MAANYSHICILVHPIDDSIQNSLQFSFLFLVVDMVGSFLVFVADAEKALKRAAKGFSRESRALDTVFGGSRNMAVGFWISNRTQPTF